MTKRSKVKVKLSIARSFDIFLKKRIESISSILVKEKRFKHKNYLNCSITVSLLILFTFFSIDCELGYFGMGCKEVCSSHCLNNDPCDHVSGMCPNGCQDGYNGSNCQNSKKYVQGKPNLVNRFFTLSCD